MPRTVVASTGAARPRARANARRSKAFRGNFVIGWLRDLPVRAIKESEAERQACFAKAWAQKYARETGGGIGSKPVASKTTASEIARLAALNRAKDSDSD